MEEEFLSGKTSEVRVLDETTTFGSEVVLGEMRKTAVAEPTSREAMDMPADVAEDLGSSSVLLFC